MDNRDNSVTQVLIRTIVKKALKDIKEYPERNTRNLVDMALHFSEGRFQTRFFEAAQTLLHNEQSSYYKLIQDFVLHADTERILNFGMNIGYRSCTLGADIIRQTEQERHFNIPWALTLITDLAQDSDASTLYQPIIDQGKALGIYTWVFFSENHTRKLLPLIQDNPDCAFILFCPAHEITKELTEDAASLSNLMFSVQYGEQTEAACDLLRANQFLYSVHFLYGEENFEWITDGDFLSHVQTLHPAFTIFISSSSCPKHLQQKIYDYICLTRNAQKYETIPFDLLYDNLAIDEIISDDSCSAGFDSNGNLFHIWGQTTNPECNIFQNTLSDIFKQSFPKKTGK